MFVCEAAIQPDAAHSAKTAANRPPGVSSVFPPSLFPATVLSFYTVLDRGLLLLLLSVRLSVCFPLTGVIKAKTDLQGVRRMDPFLFGSETL